MNKGKGKNKGAHGVSYADSGRQKDRVYIYKGIGQCVGTLARKFTVIIPLFLLLLFSLFVSCTPKEVVLEKVREVHTHSTDTIRQSDTVRLEKTTTIREANSGDSAMLAKLGLKLKANERLLLVLQRELEKEKSREERYTADTVVKKEVVDKPVYVEKELSLWESLCMEYGKIMIGATIVSLFVLISRLVVRIRQKRP